MAVARARHPWNTDFEWCEHRGPFSTIDTAQARAYDELGFFVFHDAFDAETIAAIDGAIAPGERKARDFLASRPGGRFDVAGVDTQTVAPHLVVRSPLLAALCAAPPLAGIAADLLGLEVHLYWDQAVYKQPHSAEPVLWHQDNGYTYVEPQAYLTCWVALTDATPDNGCVTVLPGAHREGTLAHEATPIGFECWGDDALAEPVPVRAGSVVVFSSLTPHRTGRNRTGAVRKAYIVQYAPAGALAYRPAAGGERGPAEAQDDPRRQFAVVRGGRPTGDDAGGLARPAGWRGHPN